MFHLMYMGGVVCNIISKFTDFDLYDFILFFCS
jgi:hypothetical protein